MVGKEVKKIRMTLGLTQEAFAHELGVTLSTVNRWENGRTKPSRLATILIKRLVNDRRIKVEV